MTTTSTIPYPLRHGAAIRTRRLPTRLPFSKSFLRHDPRIAGNIDTGTANTVPMRVTSRPMSGRDGDCAFLRRLLTQTNSPDRRADLPF
jgi:hypothetical protein